MYISGCLQAKSPPNGPGVPFGVQSKMSKRLNKSSHTFLAGRGAHVVVHTQNSPFAGRKLVIHTLPFWWRLGALWQIK